MEEQAWKTVIVATLFTLLVLSFAYFLISPREHRPESGTVDKAAEFKEVKVVGKKEGKPAFEFFALYGWSTKNQEITYLFEVTSGVLYKKGKPLMKNLAAKRVKAYRDSEVVEIFGFEEGSPEGESKFFADLNLGQVSNQGKDKKEWIKLSADYLKYWEKEKRSEAKGKIKIIKEKSQIFAEKLFMDHEKKVANLQEEVKLFRKDGELTAEEIEYLGEEETLIAKGKVNFKISEKNKKETFVTYVKCEKAVFSPDAGKEFLVQGSIEVLQKKKMSIAEEGRYLSPAKELVLSGGVITVMEKGGVIFKEETAEKLRNPQAKEMLKEKTMIYCEKLIFSTKTGNAQAFGSVEVSQKGKIAKADFARYDDQAETLILTGNSFLKKEKDWIKCKEIVISIKNETFEAKGEVEAEFKL